MKEVNYERIGRKDYVKSMTGTHVIEVCPSLAKDWIKLNTSNRPLSKSHVIGLKYRMDNGEWRLNGQNLLFSKDGSLLDGQHRLKALIEHGKCLYFGVTFGLDGSVFDTLDEGMKRRTSDVLYRANVPQATLTAAIVSKVMAEELGHANNTGFAAKKVTNKSALDWYLNNSGISEVVKESHNLYSKGGRLVLKSSWIGYVMWITSTIDEQKSEEFVKELCLGVGLTANSPVLLLRNKLISMNNNKHQKWTRTMIRGMIVKTWNYYIEGRSVKRLHYDPSKEKYIAFKGFNYK